jgi:hypothetical protein
MKIHRIAPISIVFVRSAILALTLISGIYLLPGICSLFGQGKWTAEVLAQEVGVLRVTITPQEAIDAGAQWRVDGGIWRNSGVSLGIEAGSHAVSFKGIDGWDAPADIPVTIIADAITEATGVYTVIRSLRVFITPAGAIDAGAQWNVDGGPWQDSGTTVPDLSVGDHAVNYKDVFGWSAPSSETVTIVAGQITETTGTYTQLFGSLQVFITPQAVINEGAQWKVDDGYWQQSGTTISDLPAGEHTVFYKGVFGWTRPPDQTVTIYDSQVTVTAGNYTQITTGVTLHVPSEYTTIQAAINAASDGDTVLVADGTYVGLWNMDLDFKGKAIKVVSENGPGNCIIDCERRGRGFYLNNNERQDSVISGLTITKGIGDKCGGGIYCGDFSSPTIDNCVISENSADEMHGPAFGGGIYSSRGSPVISSCIIFENRAGRGGYGAGISIGSGSPVIRECIVSGNVARGIYMGSPMYRGYFFSGNRIYNKGSGSPVIADAGEEILSAGGGGIYVGDGSPLISDCVVFDNKNIGDGSFGGGGIYIGNGNGSITNCIVFRNTICPLIGSGRGGGIRCSCCTITNCTITQNSFDNAPSEWVYGAGVSCSPAAQIVNTIVWNNSVEVEEVEGFPVIKYSDIKGGYSGEGNIDTDPLFADPENDNYHLRAGSPCINTGTSEGAPATDIDGTPRPQGAGFDMGAYEVKAFVYVSHDGICDENNPCYSTIQDGIDWDGFMFTIKAEQGVFGEHIVLDQFKKVFFQGGWDAEFTTASGATKVNSMTISDGTMVLEKGCLSIGQK